MSTQQILLWSGIIIAVAGALKAALFLIAQSRKAGTRGYKWLQEKKRVSDILELLTNEEGWPNGSHSIIESHNALYDKMNLIMLTLDELSASVNNYIITEGKRLDGDHS